MRRSRHGEFERLYADHAQSLLAFLVYRTGDRVAAEDLLADTFERVLTARQGYDRKRGSEKTWLYSIALNLVRDQARRSQTHDRAVQRVFAGGNDLNAGPNVFDTVDDRDALRRALATLRGEERDVVSLRYGADLTLPEIARLTGEKLTTVEGRLYAALRKLRGELDLG